MFLESLYYYFTPGICIFILHTLFHNISLCFVLFSPGTMFLRSTWMNVETAASHSCTHLHGVQPPPLTCPLLGCLQQLPAVQAWQILLFALLPTLRHRLNRDYSTLFPERALEGTVLVFHAQVEFCSSDHLGYHSEQGSAAQCGQCGKCLRMFALLTLYLLLCAGPRLPCPEWEPRHQPHLTTPSVQGP